jgi:hypothetical protein
MGWCSHKCGSSPTFLRNCAISVNFLMPTGPQQSDESDHKSMAITFISRLLVSCTSSTGEAELDKDIVTPTRSHVADGTVEYFSMAVYNFSVDSEVSGVLSHSSVNSHALY